MATISSFYDNRRILRVDVVGLVAAENSISFLLYTTKLTRVSYTGTFGGATITIQQSNDGTNWSQAHAPLTVAGSVTFVFNGKFWRIAVAGGDGTTNLTAHVRALLEG